MRRLKSMANDDWCVPCGNDVPWRCFFTRNVPLIIDCTLSVCVSNLAMLLLIFALQKIEMLRTAHELQQVSEHMDWEKLRDQYLLAIYSEESSNHRQLKKRAPRPQKKGRRKYWHVDAIESNLEHKAAKAINEARGIGSHKTVNKGLPKVDRGNANSNAMSVGTVQPPEEVTAVSRSVAPVASVSPVASVAPVTTNAPVATVAPVSPAPYAGINRAADTNEFPISVTGKHADTVMAGALKDAKSAAKNTTQQGDDVSFNGKPIENYSPSKGNCPGPGDVALIPIPCAPDNLSKICNKYDDTGSFRACFEACKPSFCCVHGTQFCENGQI